MTNKCQRDEAHGIARGANCKSTKTRRFTQIVGRAATRIWLCEPCVRETGYVWKEGVSASADAREPFPSAEIAERLGIPREARNAH